MQKIKNILLKYGEKIILTICGILLFFLGFGAGQLLLVRKPETITIEKNSDQHESANKENKYQENYGKYVASVDGNVYYMASSQLAGEIEDDKKLWFDTEEEAKEQGYIAENGNIESENIDEEKDVSKNISTDDKYVASKNGTKYYLPECSGVKRIKEENKVWFDSTADAEANGYEPAKNCKGLTK